MKPNSPHSAYHVARPSVRLTGMYMVRLYEARTERDELLRNRTNTQAIVCEKLYTCIGVVRSYVSELSRSVAELYLPAGRQYTA
ncbi:hypothetical protein EVAR_72097_1 [Eumeta japonica]|uniref:Uncharacterized protein n=1 Tax=Eumeta variegata TaxID=151549 RepID=A0A4C2A6S7_EUMVA|nr:hypothetical protein EVAR_72097_1 [Eumeta japonica]